MTNDRFDDALRRKLEEVKPPYQEKNWFQLQRFMAGQGFPPSIWQSPLQWLQPALTAAAVAGLLVTTVWQYRANQAMTERLATLTQTLTRLEQRQTSLQQAVTNMANAPHAAESRATAPGRVDTVWVVQRVPVAVRAGTLAGDVRQPKSLLSQQPFSPNQPVETPVYATPTVTNRETSRVTTTSPTVAEATPSVVGAETATRPTRARPTPPDAFIGSETRRLRASQTPEQAGTLQADRLADESPMATQTNQSGQAAPTNQANPTTRADQAEPTVVGTLGTLPLNPMAGISAVDEAIGWRDQWERQLRRVRYRSPFASAVASPEKNTNPVNLRWRLGVGGDVSTIQAGMGVYGEVVINNRLTISTGIGQATWAGDSYQTEVEFNKRYKVDFRHIYGGGLPRVIIGPGPTVRPRQAIDINRTGGAIVVPIQLGYRVGLGNQLFLTPFIGMNLGLNPTETVSFEDERYLPRDYERLNISVGRPSGLYSSWAVGFGLERQFGPFVTQLGPTATAPLNRQAGSLNTASVGLRARLFYQF